MSIIVYGPPGCGKTRNALRLAAFFNASVIVDNWDPKQHRGTPGALHLTNERPNFGVGRTYEFNAIKLPNAEAEGCRFEGPRFKSEPITSAEMLARFDHPEVAAAVNDQGGGRQA